jgi:cysteine-S-conjugate beta-lyase
MGQLDSFDFDTVLDRRATASYKWGKYGDHDVIPLWVADMDFRSAPAIVEALEQRVAHGVFGYTYAPSELVKATTSFLADEYAWCVDPEWLVWMPGVVSALNVLCRAVGKPGDEVATFTPIYPPFMSAPRLAGRGLARVPLTFRQGRYEMDLDALDRTLSPRTRLLLLCSPQNPGGRAWSREELQALASLAVRRNLIVGSDEIHAGLILDPGRRHVVTASLSEEMASRTVTLMAPSKTYNIPGLGCSFAVISNRELRQAFSLAMEGIVPHVNALGFTAAQAAYEKGGSWLQELLAYLRGNRDLVEREIASMPGLQIVHAEATYLAWIDTRTSGLVHPARFFEDAGVGLSDGADFDAPGFVRLNFGCPRSLLEEALDRMRTALNRAVQSGIVKASGESEGTFGDRGHGWAE